MPVYEETDIHELREIKNELVTAKCGYEATRTPGRLSTTFTAWRSDVTCVMCLGGLPESVRA